MCRYSAHLYFQYFQLIFYLILWKLAQFGNLNTRYYIMFGSDAHDIVYGDGTGGSGKADTTMSIESLAFNANATNSKKVGII